MIENFINTKPKAYIVFSFSIASLFILAFSTQVAVIICSKWYGLIVGMCLMLLVIPLHVSAKKWTFLYVFSFIINFIGCGFSVSAYYLTKGISLKFFELILAVAPAIAILVLVYLMLSIYSKTKRITLCIATVLNIALLVVAIVFWIRTGAVFFSFGFFCLLVSIFFICVFGVTINHDERHVLKDISYASFGAFVILTVVVIVILSEGDALDICDLGIDVNGRKKNKKTL